MSSGLERAVAALRSGGVVLHATEGVWGFACDPFSREAFDKILQIKGREEAKGVLLIAAQSEVFAAQLADLGHRQAVEASWPGHHTWVLPNKDAFAPWITGGRDTVACRVPAHEQARQLCAAFQGPLVSTSANRSGAPAITTQTAAFNEFAAEVDCCLAGAVSGAGKSSTIHGLDGTILRA